MENASKALLIAGAVLIVILLIGVGMMIYNGATSTINSSTGQMNAQQIQMANQQFTAYEGDKIAGTKVKSLLSLIAANSASDDDFVMQFIGTDAANGTAITSDSGDIIGSTASKITSSHKYIVHFYDGNDDGLLDKVFIQDTNSGT